MPIYLTKCTICAHENEVIIPMTADLPACTVCGAKTEKVPAPANGIFRGRGWTPKSGKGRSK